MHFYSEDHIDSWLFGNGYIGKEGEWVDVGCAHPFRYSNTAFLRGLGWTGIAIDGDAAYRPEWESVENAHFVHAVISDEPETRFLVEPTNALVSRCHEQGALVQAQRLGDILQRGMMDQIDFLSLDVEGMEMEALKTIDLDKHNVGLIVAEYCSCHKGQDFRVLHYLLHPDRGYELIHATSNNFVFKRI